jgi:hypothetical protein
MSEIINLQVESQKQTIQLNGNPEKVIELDLGDSNIITRLSEGVDKIENLVKERQNLHELLANGNDSDESNISYYKNLASKFKELENSMRGIINEIFDFDVCTPFLGTSSVFSIKNGEFAYERIINSLMGLYEDSIQKENNKLKERLSKHTDKYLNKK